MGSCSVLELFILVAIYRIKRRGHDSANFEMVHDEYCKLMEQGGTADKRSKAAALRAFERLIAYRLVSYADSRYLDMLCFANQTCAVTMRLALLVCCILVWFKVFISQLGILPMGGTDIGTCCACYFVVVLKQSTHSSTAAPSRSL